MTITSKYLSLAQADTRYTRRLPTKIFTVTDEGEELLFDVWADASTDEREQALFEATIFIDSFVFDGEKADKSQEKAFPRKGQAEIPEEVLKCTMDLALFYLKEYMLRVYGDANRQRLLDEGVTGYSLRIGDYQEQVSEYNTVTPQSILRPYLNKWITGRYYTSAFKG